MEICEPRALATRDFRAVLLNSLIQHWHTTRSFGCIGAPKRQDLLLYLDGCRITYTDRSGRVLTAESGDVVYTPEGSEYRAELSDFRDAEAHTVGINLRLLDERGGELALARGIAVFRGVPASVGELFHRVAADGTGSLLGRRIALLEILSALSGTPIPTARDSLAPALERLARHRDPLPTVGELAALCHMSEVWFRRRFREAHGVTPSEYRTALRLERARSYLEYGEISVQEISDVLGYATASHFIKEFKRRYGLSPLAYRKASRGAKGEYGE